MVFVLTCAFRCVENSQIDVRMKTKYLRVPFNITSPTEPFAVSSVRSPGLKEQETKTYTKPAVGPKEGAGVENPRRAS